MTTTQTKARTGTTTYATPTDRALVITRAFAAARPRVFDAWTNPRQLPSWLLGPEGWTMPVCEIHLREGGTWRYVWRKADGAEMTMTGTFREVAPPGRLVTTEAWGPPWPETLNTLELTEAAGLTTMTLTVLYPSKEAREAAVQPGMKAGLDKGFDRLDELLAQAT